MHELHTGNVVFLLVWSELSYTPKSAPSLLNSGDDYEEDLKITIWKTTSTTFPIFFNISLILVRIKLHTKFQPPSLLNSGDGYEEDLNRR